MTIPEVLGRLSSNPLSSETIAFWFSRLTSGSDDLLLIQASFLVQSRMPSFLLDRDDVAHLSVRWATRSSPFIISARNPCRKLRDDSCFRPALGLNRLTGN